VAYTVWVDDKVVVHDFVDRRVLVAELHAAPRLLVEPVEWIAVPVAIAADYGAEPPDDVDLDRAVGRITRVIGLWADHLLSDPYFREAKTAKFFTLSRDPPESRANFYLDLPATIQRPMWVLLRVSEQQACEGGEHRLTIRIIEPHDVAPALVLTSSFVMRTQPEHDAQSEAHGDHRDRGYTVAAQVVARIPATMLGHHAIELNVDDDAPYRVAYWIGTRQHFVAP
jgi:hypothetical protein